jgi:uncharacterized protein DUF6636
VGRIVLFLVLMLAVPACGGQDTETVTKAVTVVETQPPAGTNSATVTVTTTATTNPALTSRRFQMPSKNIGCQTGEGVLVCDILSGLHPEPTQNCELDWTGMELERLGPAQPRCAGDTAYDQSAPVLEYGSSWSRDGFTCASMTNGVQCRNEENHGFLLSRQTWTQF